MAYVKLFGSLLNSTVWAEPLATRVVWISMLALADQDGNVHARAPGIAKAAGVTRAEVDAALATFLAPDPDSRTKDHGGRRIEETPEGFRLLNYEAYRDRASKEDRLAKAAARQKRWRERNRDVTRERDESVTRNPSKRAVTQVTHSVSSQSHLISDSSQSQSQQHRENARTSPRWATILSSLRAVHGSTERYDPSPGGKHREALDWIAQRPEAEWATVIKHYAADPWVKANPGRAHPVHVRTCWDKYLDGPMVIPTNGASKGPVPAKSAADYDDAGGQAPWEL